MEHSVQVQCMMYLCSDARRQCSWLPQTWHAGPQFGNKRG